MRNDALQANADRGNKKGWWRTKKGKSFSFLLYRTPLRRHTRTISRCSTIRSAALPSHKGGIAPFFQCPAIKRASVN